MGILADIKAVVVAGAVCILCLILWYADHNRLERKVVTLQAEAKADESAIRDLRQAVADRDESLVALRLAVSEQSAKIQEMQERARALRSALDIEAGNVSERQQRIEDLQAQIMLMGWPGTCEDTLREAIRFVQGVIPGGGE